MAGPRTDQRWLRRVLHDETVGGGLMLAAAALGVIAANSPLREWYRGFTDHVVSVPGTGLHLTTLQWAADFLLAFFFLVAGAELKHELTSGTLASMRQAVVPVLGAVGGMAASAGVFLAVCAASGADAPARQGWAIPTSTDIAFALAVLAIAGRGVHPGVRVLLLGLAVMNDVGSILIIAAAFAGSVKVVPLLVAAVCVAIWALLQRQEVRFGPVYAAVFVVGWWAMHDSGVHATIVGMAFGLACSTAKSRRDETGADVVDRVLRPWVAGAAVPLFAFVSVGVDLTSGGGGIAAPGAAVILGLVVGQPLGVAMGFWVARRWLRGEVAPGLGRRQLAVVACLAGVGFTVALLVSELAFAHSPGLLAQAKVGVLCASVATSVLAACVMRFARGARTDG
ncbi:MAG: Na+/H+ antiporter NhaA [Actinomycetales bacterium]|nr:Na+/H+ antiporter NhaA [Actinomycetales bacterium]